MNLPVNLVACSNAAIAALTLSLKGGAQPAYAFTPRLILARGAISSLSDIGSWTVVRWEKLMWRAGVLPQGMFSVRLSHSSGRAEGLLCL
uniref:Uncharacterized protein n=1 Tax=Aspergillus fumigatus TaxID=746128 RepID=Q6MYB6_ASPFM|nr:hypothetical protein AfA35g10.16 [Aspergillus fumigatus]